ncbi:unnamed protein product, partial [Amoebophrya sp. A25]
EDEITRRGPAHGFSKKKMEDSNSLKKGKRTQDGRRRRAKDTTCEGDQELLSEEHVTTVADKKKMRVVRETPLEPDEAVEARIMLKAMDIDENAFVGSQIWDAHQRSFVKEDPENKVKELIASSAASQTTSTTTTTSSTQAKHSSNSKE